jgi:hypothetical protein
MTCAWDTELAKISAMLGVQNSGNVGTSRTIKILHKDAMGTVCKKTPWGSG